MTIFDRLVCAMAGAFMAFSMLNAMLGEALHAAGSFALAALCWGVTYWQPGEKDHD